MDRGRDVVVAGRGAAAGGRARGGAARRARLVVRFGGARPISRVRLEPPVARHRASGAACRSPSVDELPRGDGRLTALVTGAGRSRRIFIASELIRDWSDDEVAVVAAHELGHHAHHDLWRTLALDALLLSLALWLADDLLAGAPGPRWPP